MKKTIIAGALSLASLIAASPVQSATFNVSTSAALRDALITATGNGEDDEIILAKGIYTPGAKGPFTYFSTLGNDLTMRAESGSVEGDVVLDGEGTSNILVLKQDTHRDDQRFYLNGLTLKNGQLNSDSIRGAAAVAILNGAATIENSTFSGNVSDSSYSGSAIYFDGGDRSSEISLSSVKVMDNTHTSDSTLYNGATVYVLKGTVSISESKITRNKNQSTGTLYVKNSYTLTTIIDSIFAGNEAYNGGAIDASSGSLKLDNVEFTGNKAQRRGGAIAAGKVEGYNVNFSNNIAQNAGGAISAGTLILDNSRITANQGNRREIILASTSADISNTLFLNNSIGGTLEQKGIVYCRDQCNIVNNVFDSNTGAPGVLIGDWNGDKLVANTVFLASNDSAIDFYSTSGKASVFNNFLASSLETLPPAQVDQRNNILDSTNPGLDTDYAPVPGSVLIDSGINDTNLVTLPGTDALGNRRIAGDGVDIGMIEFGSSATAPAITSLSLQNIAPKKPGCVGFQREL